jgi:hypothetical protein
MVGFSGTDASAGLTARDGSDDEPGQGNTRLPAPMIWAARPPDPVRIPPHRGFVLV